MIALHAIFGYASGIVSIIALIRYVTSIIRGTTKPSRVTWWVLAFLNGALAASYMLSGAHATIWLPLSYGIGFLIIALLSLRYGEGSWTQLDRVCFFGAIAGIFVWWFLRSPLLAFWMFTAVDLIGIVPLIYKTYRRPSSEDRTSWVIGTFATFLNVLAIETWAPEVAIYPIYVFTSNALMLYFIVHPRTERQLTTVSV